MAHAVNPADTDEPGVEAEFDDGLLGKTTSFNPEKIKIFRDSPAIRLINDRIDDGEIDIEPDFQRRARIWKLEKKSRLIESILLKITMPAFYVAADLHANWAVVDGLQRLTTIYDFCNGEFNLRGLEYLEEFDGASYADLPRNMKRRILETELHVNVIDPGTPEEIVFNIFKRINTGGQSLNGQEIRNALHKGPVRAFLQQLAEAPAFQKATDKGVSGQRLMDREFVLRYLAFKLTSWKDYKSDDLDSFLNATMDTINRMQTPQLVALHDEFIHVMGVSQRIFGFDAFRKRYSVNDARKPLNKALFETWSVCLSTLDMDEQSTLITKKAELKALFSTLLHQDRDFETSISASTSACRRVHYRFEKIESLLREVLDAPPSEIKEF